MTQARMDGTAEEQLMWRVDALREALRDIKTMDDPAAMTATAGNALDVDNDNASTCAGAEPDAAERGRG